MGLSGETRDVIFEGELTGAGVLEGVPFFGLHETTINNSTSKSAGSIMNLFLIGGKLAAKQTL